MFHLEYNLGMGGGDRTPSSVLFHIPKGTVGGGGGKNQKYVRGGGNSLNQNGIKVKNFDFLGIIRQEEIP